MDRRSLLFAIPAMILAGCAGTWEVAYESTLDPLVTKSWNVQKVNVLVSEDLRVSNKNTLAPNADIVWHGEPYGDRRAQVKRIMEEGITRGTTELDGPRGVIINASLVHFHAVTPAAVSRSPAAVHNIKYVARVFDAQTGVPLTEAQEIAADLEAFVGASAVTAALEGNTQRVRIVSHLGRVTRGWLGLGPDQRRRFSGVGR
ncbi:MAG: hypothetical protein HKN18_10915 [Silicimonas sp.]|nr:hypothetical protein [Silicimonas sp.]